MIIPSRGDSRFWKAPAKFNMPTSPKIDKTRDIKGLQLAVRESSQYTRGMEGGRGGKVKEKRVINTSISLKQLLVISYFLFFSPFLMRVSLMTQSFILCLLIPEKEGGGDREAGVSLVSPSRCLSLELSITFSSIFFFLLLYLQPKKPLNAVRIDGDLFSP